MAMSGALMMAAAAGAQGVQSTSNLAGQILANQANRAATGKQMRWQDANIQKAMDFQREMSGSVYQRAVADMKKAGINPMLLASKGMSPAPAPSGGGSGSASPIKQDAVTTDIANGITSALSLAKLTAETAKINAEVDRIKALQPLAEFEGSAGGIGTKVISSTYPAIKDFSLGVRNVMKNVNQRIASARELRAKARAPQKIYHY